MSTLSRRLGAAAVTAGAAAVAWGTLIEPHLFTLRRESLPLLPARSAPIRILHLSDLHLAPWQRHKIDWVRSLAELRPDLVVLTGDLMGHQHARTALGEALGAFPASGARTVFVHGSNDYYAPIMKNPLAYLRAPSRLGTKATTIDTAALTSMFTGELGFVDLNNTAARMRVRETDLVLFGLNDPHIRLDRAEAMTAALAQVDAEQTTGPSTRIGVVHAPYRESLRTFLDHDAELVLAGHTHGGQVRIPGVGALTSNCDLPLSQARGLSVTYSPDTAAFLHVSAGLGHSIYSPVRFACRPEATILTLTAPEPATRIAQPR